MNKTNHMGVAAKYLSGLGLALIIALSASAQQKQNWQNQDLQKDSVFGISTDKAYSTLLMNKTPHPVIVAVIDAGIDTAHEDLKSTLWVNPHKMNGDNGTYGWSYIGSAKGNVRYDNLELTRQVRRYQQQDTAKLSPGDLAAYHEEKAELLKKQQQGENALQGIGKFRMILGGITAKLGKGVPALADFKGYQPQNDNEAYVRNVMVNALSQNDDYAGFVREQIDGAIEHFRAQKDYHLNPAYDPRAIVGDNYADDSQNAYGSPDNNGPDPTHGTHVAGIIAAVRNNGIGMNGIADDVRILGIRAVPDGDERDKDIANAIRYAADHGAKVINMSFGKPLSPDKKAVDAAVTYALKKDVLLVQAAGNDGKDIDNGGNFPSRKFLNGEEAGAWIVVGASGMKDDSTLKAPFSNYGKTAVDVFAPGLQIYSSVPGSRYAYFDGTSMACPVVAGLAALIREYYPKLKAQQVKDIILQSVVKVSHPVLLSKKKVPFTDLCLTGGIVNAYNALELAGKYQK